MDDEVAQLDSQLAEAESRVKDLEILLHSAQCEWEELYPYEVLEFSLAAIKRLGKKLLAIDPEDLEAQELLAEALDKIPPKLEEPTIFYLE